MQLGALLGPLALHHLGQPVDDDVEKAADEQAQHATDRGLQPQRLQHQTT
ncbi:hypothetical protein ACFSTJ_12735 [Ottowia pentelensis]